MDELRDRIVEAIHSMSGVSAFPLDMLHDDYTDTLEAQAQAVIDALGLHQIEGAAKPSEEIRKAKAEGWNRAINHVEIWIKFNLGKDTLFEFEEDDHPNPYEDDKEDG